jgi:hypothetical protein
MTDWKWVWKKALLSIPLNYTGAPLEGPSKMTEHLSQDSWCRPRFELRTSRIQV